MNALKNCSIQKTKILILVVFAFALNAQAKQAPDIYRVGLSGGWVNYVEPGYISFYGAMFGLDGIIQLNFNSNFDLRIEGDLYYGNVQYDGSVKDTVTNAVAPLKAGAYDFIMVARVKPEFQVASTGAADFFLNFGVGGRYLNDRVNSTSGYQREVSYIFLPIGGRTEIRAGQNIFGIDLEYDFFAIGKVKSHLSDTNPANPDVTNTQSTGYGIRAQLEWRFLAGSTWYGVKPYFQWWNVGSSDAQPYVSPYVLVEPQNSSSMTGVVFDADF